jgi:hypothetical protein
MSEYNRHKFALEWMHGGGRDPNGRGLDEEIQIADDMWKERVSMAEGGTPQLVQPGPGRPGYQGRGGPRGDPSDPARQFTQKKNKWNRIKTVIDEVAETGDINILKSQTRKTGGKLTLNQANILSNASTDPDVFNEAVKFLDMDRKELRSLLNKREANIADVKAKAATKKSFSST